MSFDLERPLPEDKIMETSLFSIEQDSLNKINGEIFIREMIFLKNKISIGFTIVLKFTYNVIQCNDFCLSHFFHILWLLNKSKLIVEVRYIPLIQYDDE